ncbi:MAG: LLM class flavin-dependent oxidoreductase [Actinomycetia bacterium]|nr:LLM class flavin-dependent oxidoreductase [Actinomycetes bacterium]MCP4222912.1 LLM class flavin-dependent oxidoreductase [Actinomycetes bacterium]MCP5032096.1 LLM class flavin-dependent oxidoreductase [Actinomycetes bacterium]
MIDNEATSRMPAISLAAVAGRRISTVELAREIEDRGFSGIFCPSFGDAMGLCLSIAHVTSRLEIGTAIQPIYLQHPSALATSAAYLHEIAEGRFRLGIGVTHGPVHGRLGIEVGKPLADTRAYVEEMRRAAKPIGGLPPLTLAALRDKMVALSVEISEGAVWANASRSRMAHSLSNIPQDRIDGGFYVGNMIPTVIDDDREAGAARNRATLKGYVALPNYRNYWKDAGYEEEMTAVETAMETKDSDGVLAAMSDKWLSDCTLYGSVGEVREGVEAWLDAGVGSPILVPSSTSGGQVKAFQELFDAYQS